MSSEFVVKSYPTNFSKKDWSKRKIFFRYATQEFLDELHNFEVREDDVWVVTLEKSGTTWMQELVWLLVNNCDFDVALNKPQELRSPFLESSYFLGEDTKEYCRKLQTLKGPRVIKSHLPLPLLPKQLWTKKPKLIYVFRNPKDARVSAYHYHRNVLPETAQTLPESIENDLSEEIRTNSIWNHVLEFYELRNEPWIHYTSFERMKKDLRKEIEDVCAFLEIKITEVQMKKMLKHLSFEEMKNNPQCNHLYEIEEFRKKRGITDYGYSRFVRKGQVDSHKEELPENIIKKLDQWIDDSLRPHNLTINDLLLL